MIKKILCKIFGHKLCYSHSILGGLIHNCVRCKVDFTATPNENIGTFEEMKGEYIPWWISILG